MAYGTGLRRQNDEDRVPDPVGNGDRVRARARRRARRRDLRVRPSPRAREKAVVSGTALPEAGESGARLTPREIDDAVSATVAAGEPIYTLDVARIGAIQPDLILAQDLCRVCAVPSGAVEDALAVLGCRSEVLSLDPSTLDEVLACIGAVGEATGTRGRADEVVAGPPRTCRRGARRDRVAAARSTTSCPRARVVGPAVQRRSLGARHDRGCGWRSHARTDG